MTNHDRIRGMSLNELAESAVKEMVVTVNGEKWFMSMLDCTCHLKREDAVAYNKVWLEREVQ